MEFAQRLKGIRQSAGLSCGQLARKASISEPYLRQLENGRKKNPTGNVLKKLSAALGVTLADLLGSPLHISKGALDSAPISLKQFALKRGKTLGLRQEDLEMLKGVHYRGRQPSNVEDWELVFSFIRRILQ